MRAYVAHNNKGIPARAPHSIPQDLVDWAFHLHTQGERGGTDAGERVWLDVLCTMSNVHLVARAIVWMDIASLRT